jgi:phage protein D
LPAVSYRLIIDEQPADEGLLEAIQQLEVEDHADMADMLRLRLSIGVRDGCNRWSALDDDIFQRLTNIKVMVTVGNAAPERLMEAYVIETSADFANQPGQSVLNVVAMDPTVLMNLKEDVRRWPDMADSDIATSIFGDYNFLPQVDSTEPSRQSDDVTTIQRGTDIQFLRTLAHRNGFECYVEANPTTGDIEGHFHPPQNDQAVQGVLTVNMGEATNVNSFNARYDMLRPTAARVTGLDIESQEDQPADAQETGLAEMGQETTIARDRPRQVMLAQTGLSQTGELQTLAQSVTDRSAWAISAQGELNTVAYGGILRAKRPVNVRGAGRQFSGTYYVEQVHHSFTGDSYTQRFTLRRNATGLTGREQYTEK